MSLLASRLADPGLLAVIKGKTKGVSEGGQSPFRAIRLGAFERQLMGFTGCGSSPFAHAGAFADDGDVAGPDTHADLGDIGGKMGPSASFTVDATGGDGPPVPRIKPKDPIGLGNHVPTLDIVEEGAFGLARLYISRFELGLE